MLQGNISLEQVNIFVHVKKLVKLRVSEHASKTRKHQSVNTRATLKHDMIFLKYSWRQCLYRLKGQNAACQGLLYFNLVFLPHT